MIYISIPPYALYPRLHRSGGTQVHITGNAKRFPNCNRSEDCIHDQGTSKNDKAVMA